MSLEQKNVLIVGGTGSLGKVLVRRLLSCEMGRPAKIIIFSRDEAKQHYMRLDYLHRKTATDDVIYQNFQKLLTFRIGDVRDFNSVTAVMRETDIVFNAAALKQVPTCEYFPYEGVQTNIIGAENIARAIKEFQLPIETVVGISTDKACKPVNVMGMTKAIQERIFINANLNCPQTRFVCVRYGNVLASRGSVIPLFHDQISAGGPVTITTPDMTRFLLSLDQGVDTIFAAFKGAKAGETYIPRIKSAKVTDVADVLISNRPIKKVITGIRPGEKVHEILVSEEEICRTVDRGAYYAIKPILPEIDQDGTEKQCLIKEFSSADNLMTKNQVAELLKKHHLTMEDKIEYE
jgi:UDP-glucose 4-epimerase